MNFLYRLRKAVASGLDFISSHIEPDYIPDEFSAMMSSFRFITVTTKKEMKMFQIEVFD